MILQPTLSEIRQRYFPDSPWNKTKHILPSYDNEMVDVIFCSPDWGWPIFGSFLINQWYIYDQINDIHHLWDRAEPEYWVAIPKIPKGELDA